HIVMPGLVNAHSHSQSAFTKLAGTGDRTNVITALWYGYAHGLNRTPRDIYVGTLLHAIQLLKTGCTCVIDQFRFQGLPEIDEIEQTVNAYQQAGMRARVAFDMHDRGGNKTILPSNIGNIPESAIQMMQSRTMTFDDQVRVFRQAADTWNRKQEGRVQVVPTSPVATSCTDRLLQTIAGLAEEYDTATTCHLLEHPKDRKTAISLWGKPEIEHLAEIGFLGKRLCVAHVIWVEDQEIDILAKHQTSVVHNPELNMRLGGGRAPIREMMNAGVNVALGADSSTSQNLFEVMKITALIHRLGKPAPADWLYADEIIRMATIQGARDLCVDDVVGSIENGKDADLVFLNQNSPWLTPLNDLPSRLVYFENGFAVDIVMVKGKVVVKGGKIQTFDEDSVIEEARVLGAALLERNRDFYRLADQMTEILQPEIQALETEAYERRSIQ
ncbi:MAG: amidohydrolase family protein, partial [Chloroflexi bacterium]|nr:amidohydrolase family protein [Chloroflexota bacterium]